MLWSFEKGTISTPYNKNLALLKDMSTINNLDVMSVVDRHRCHMEAKFRAFVDEDHSKLPTLYWLLH